MIQRIQTVFLLIAAIILAASMVMPIAIYSNLIENQQHTIAIYQYLKPVNGINLLPLFISGALAAVITLFSIFLYKNRKFQINISRINIILILIYIGLIAYFLYSLKSLSNSDNTVMITYQIGTVFPVIALIFDVLAITRIKKDDKLVKSLDRLR